MVRIEQSKDVIAASTLKTCEGKRPKTQIAYEADLNSEVLNPYLELLVKNDLLEVIEGTPTIYRTTQKGEVFLKRLKALDQTLANNIC